MHIEPPAIWSEVGARIQHLRINQGRTVDQIAASAGLSPERVRRIEAGQAGTTPAQLGSIGSALGVTTRDLWPPMTPEDYEALAQAFRDRGSSDEQVARVVQYVRAVDLLER